MPAKKSKPLTEDRIRQIIREELARLPQAQPFPVIVPAEHHDPTPPVVVMYMAQGYGIPTKTWTTQTITVSNGLPPFGSASTKGNG